MIMTLICKSTSLISSRSIISKFLPQQKRFKSHKSLSFTKTKTSKPKTCRWEPNRRPKLTKKFRWLREKILIKCSSTTEMVSLSIPTMSSIWVEARNSRSDLQESALNIWEKLLQWQNNKKLDRTETKILI